MSECPVIRSDSAWSVPLLAHHYAAVSVNVGKTRRLRCSRVCVGGVDCQGGDVVADTPFDIDEV